MRRSNEHAKWIHKKKIERGLAGHLLVDHIVLHVSQATISYEMLETVLNVF